MQEFVTDESFDLEKTYEYILSIQVNLDGFSFSVVCPTENKLMIFKSTLLKISSNSLIARHFKEWINTERLLQKPFKKIRIIVFSNKFTLIPEEYSSNELKKDIPNLLFARNSELEIAENSINNLYTRLIFALPNGLNNVIREQIGECEIIHPIKIVANNFFETERENRLLIIFDSENFYVTLLNKNKILLSNCFKQSHANDIVYYILTILKQLGIEPKTTELLYAGKLNNEDETINILRKYFNKINVLSENNPIQIAPRLVLHPIHQNFTLFK